MSFIPRLKRTKNDADDDSAPSRPESAVPIKEWRRRHEDGSIGTVLGWSDGHFTSGHFVYRPRSGGVQQGPRYPYPTLSDAIAGADADAKRHGHACGSGCTLWSETASSTPAVRPHPRKPPRP